MVDMCPVEAHIATPPRPASERPDASGPAQRRPAGPTGQRGQRARIRHAVLTFSPAALPLLPLDGPPRGGCPGRAAVHLHGCPERAAARPARRAAAPLAVPHRPQRVDFAAPTAACDRRATGDAYGPRRCRSRRPPTSARGWPCLWPTCRRSRERQRGALVMRELKRALPRGTGAGAGHLGRCGQTVGVRGPAGAGRVRGRSGHGL